MNPAELAQLVAAELVERGAKAVVLMGSHARGDALTESDIDVVAVGSGESYLLERRDGHLLSISWIDEEAIRQSFQSPHDAPGAVPGWRSASLLADPCGIAAALQREARDWTWSAVGDDACDAYVAEEITGLAEEVHKLVNLRESGNLNGAAVQRSLLSFRLGVIMAIHLRLLLDTENHLWNLVTECLGEPWASVQSRAFGLFGESFDETCLAALELYRLSAEAMSHLLNERQRSVVRYACELSVNVD